MEKNEMSGFFMEGPVRVCELDGLPVDDVLATGGLDIATIRSPGVPILRSQAAAIVSAVAAVSPDPCSAFRCGLCVPMDRSPELTQLFSDERDLSSLMAPINEALLDICHGLIEVTIGPAFARIGFGFPSWNLQHESALRQASAGALVAALRLRFGPDWVPTRVFVGNRLPVRKLVNCCRTELVLGAPDNAIILTTADANSKPRSLGSGEPLPTASSVTSFEQDHMIMVDQIRLAVRGRLSLCLSSKIDDIAEIYEISARTLKRRLSEAGITFSELVQEVKVSEAKRLLAESDLPLSEIAQSLMYSQLPSFSRAFSRSTGVSPSEFRAFNVVVG